MEGKYQHTVAQPRDTGPCNPAPRLWQVQPQTLRPSAFFRVAFVSVSYLCQAGIRDVLCIAHPLAGPLALRVDPLAEAKAGNDRGVRVGLLSAKSPVDGDAARVPGYHPRLLVGWRRHQGRGCRKDGRKDGARQGAGRRGLHHCLQFGRLTK